jgi:hypothetical protein
VRWQIKGCQTTEPRTFDSGFSGKVNLSTLSFMVHLRTYLLPSVYPITCYLGYPLYVRPSLTNVEVLDARGSKEWQSQSPKVCTRGVTITGILLFISKNF